MSVTSVSSRHARLEVLLDGIRITRSSSDASRRGTERVRTLGWDEVTGATVETSAKGRAIVRIGVLGAAAVAHHRDDPFAVKAGSSQADDATAVADLVNDEVRTRRRWRELSGPGTTSPDDLVSPA